MLGNQNRYSRILHSTRLRKTLPLLVLVLSLGATYGNWRQISRAERSRALDAYRKKTAEILSQAVERLHSDEQLLLGAVGLFQVKGVVTAADWQQYLSSLQSTLNRSSVSAVAYAKWSESPGKPVAVPVTFLVGDNSLDESRIGYNLYSAPSRREALNLARDSGAATLAEGPAGLLILAPVYHRGAATGTVEERRAALQGFVYCQIRIRDLMESASGSSRTGIAVEVVASKGRRPPSPTRSLFAQSAFSSEATLDLLGRQWTFSFRTLPAFDRQFAAQGTASTALSAGIAVSSLLAVIAWILLSTGERALAIADRMTRKLQDSESRFLSMANSASVLIWMADDTGYCTWANRAWLDFTGLTMAQTLGRGWMQAIHPADLEETIAAGDRRMKSQLSFTVEYRLRRSDGEYRTVLNSAVPHFGTDGFFTSYVGSATDITEIYLASEAVRRAEQFNRATLDALGAGICVLDGQGCILAVNRSWREFAIANPPVPKDYAVGSNYLNVCENATGPQREEALAMAEGIRKVLGGTLESYSQEYGCHSPNERRFFCVRVTRFSGPDPLRVVVAHENVTARKLAEEALLARGEQLRIAQRLAHVGSWTRFVASSRILWSEEMFRIFGRDPQLAAVGYSELPSFYTPESFGRLEDAARNTVLSGKPFDVELEIIRPDGEHRIGIARGEAVLDDTGRVDRFQGTLQDVTEMKLLGHELQKSHDLLASLSRQVPGVIYQYQVFPDGRACFHYLSDAVWDLFEVKPEEALRDASKIFATIHPDDYLRVRDSITETLSTLSPWKEEFRVILPRQGARWREGFAQRQRLGDGSVLSHGYITDITDRKRLEEELRLARFTMDNLEEGIHWVTPEGRLWNVNAAACRMLGYSHGELSSLSVPDIDPQVSAEHWQGLWPELKKTGVLRFRSINLRKDGRRFPVEVTAHYLNFNGMEYDWAIVRDISEQVQNEKVNEGRQRAILDNLPMLAWLKDSQGRFEMVNEAFASYTGLSVREMIGKTPEEVVPA
ncbi:MAG TPA: PAS domain S-box protein, partial [Bryobacteraceae bacterium]